MTKVLLVEDDLGNLTVMEDIFQFDDVGAELIVAESGEEALCLAVDNEPILILMDIHLPGMDGLEAARALKSDPRTKDVPIWAITAISAFCLRNVLLPAMLGPVSNHRRPSSSPCPPSWQSLATKAASPRF